MKTAFEETAEWKMGDSSQKQYATLISRSRNFVVLPTYGMDDVSQSTKAPVLFSKEGLVVAPDILLLSPQESFWQDVKAKSKPSWRRIGQRWEHGCDYSLALEYRRVQELSGIGVGIVVHEALSPLNDNADSPITGPAKWLHIALETALKIGEHRKDWPGGTFGKNRGRRGMGGLLWPRNEMSEIVFSKHTIGEAMADEKLTKIGAFWLREKNGKKYMSGKIDKPLAAGATLLVYKNDYKQEDKHPDYTIHAFLGDECAQPAQDGGYEQAPPVDQGDDSPF